MPARKPAATARGRARSRRARPPRHPGAAAGSIEASGSWDLRPFRASDFAAALHLWQLTPGMGLNAADSPAGIRAFLRRNPGLSWVAVRGKSLLGTALAGHDGRRGFIYHLAVAGEWQGRGIGRALVARCLDGLEKDGLTRCHIVVYAANEAGKGFWRRLGWGERPELRLFSWRFPADS